MCLQRCIPQAIRVALQGACVYVLAACLGSSFALARLEETQGTVPTEETPVDASELQTFRDAISGGYFYLALIGILASLVSVYYYLRPVIAMYFREEETPIRRVESAWGLHVTLFATSIATDTKTGSVGSLMSSRTRPASQLLR